MLQIMGPSHQLLIPPNVLMVLVALAVWETIWRLIAFWKAARNNQMGWFILMGIINSAGILEILYIAFFQKNQNHRSKD